MDATVTLRKLIAPHQVFSGGKNTLLLSGWPLKVEATAVGMPAEIFVYQRAQEHNATPYDHFIKVATVSEMYDTPVGKEPYVVDTETQIPFFRLSFAELSFPNTIDLETSWQRIKDDTQKLVESWNAHNHLVQVTAVNITADTETVAQDIPTWTAFQVPYVPAGYLDATSGYPEIEENRTDMDGWRLPDEGEIPPATTYQYTLTGELLDKVSTVSPENYAQQIQVRVGETNAVWGRDFVVHNNKLYWTGETSTFGRGPWPADYVSPEAPGTNPLPVTVNIVT